VANNLLGGIPTPTVTCNFIDEINRINNTPRLKTAENAIAFLTAPAEGEDTDIQDNKENKQEMIDVPNAVETAAIGGRATICHLILDAINKGTIEPIQKSSSPMQRERQDQAHQSHIHLATSQRGCPTRGHGNCE
jgi:hypothetical protein